MDGANLARSERSGFQVVGNAAENYEVCVSHFMGPCSDRILEFARIRAGEHVLDVACGTGFVARRAPSLVGEGGRVIGVDLNPAMIAVARSVSTGLAPSVEWHQADAQHLPVDDHRVDVAICQQGLQYFADPGAAIADMHRVLRPGGRLVASVWSRVSESPYFAACDAAIAAYLDLETQTTWAAAFGMADREPLAGLLKRGGFKGIEVQRDRVEVRLPNLNSFIPCHLASTPWGAAVAALSPAEQHSFSEVVRQRLAPYRDGEDAVVSFDYYVATACT